MAVKVCLAIDERRTRKQHEIKSKDATRKAASRDRLNLECSSCPLPCLGLVLVLVHSP